MTHTNKRCIHCKSQYIYQGSGDGRFDPLNDDKYCPDCKKVIIEALRKIPKKFESTTIPQTEVSLELAESWEQMKIDESNKNQFPYCKRVLAGLWDTKTKEWEVVNIVEGRDKFLWNQYIYRYWPSDKKNGTVKLFVELNLQTGKSIPCEEFSNTNDVDRSPLSNEEKINNSRKTKLDDILIG